MERPVLANEAQHTLVVAAERNGRTYIAVTMRTVDLGTTVQTVQRCLTMRSIISIRLM